VDRPGALGLPWTDGGVDRGGPGHDGALTGARPPAAPVRQSSPAGVQQREECTGSLPRASPGLERRRGGRATMVKAWWCRCSVRGRLECGDMRREAGRGVVNSGGGAHLLLGSGERRGLMAGEFNTSVNGFNAMEYGGGFNREIKGGEMKARW
jgi:hypothetical protein